MEFDDKISLGIVISFIQLILFIYVHFFKKIQISSSLKKI
jgi:hypothetical protein